MDFTKHTEEKDKKSDPSGCYSIFRGVILCSLKTRLK